MALYAIIAQAPNPSLAARVTSVFPDSKAWSDRSWVVKSEDTAQVVAGKLGVNQVGPATSEFGHIVVLKLAGNYWGFSTTEFWDWLQAAFQQSS